MQKVTPCALQRVTSRVAQSWVYFPCVETSRLSGGWWRNVFDDVRDLIVLGEPSAQGNVIAIS